MHDFARILETPLCLRAYLMYAPYLTHENAHQVVLQTFCTDVKGYSETYTVNVYVSNMKVM